MISEGGGKNKFYSSINYSLSYFGVSGLFFSNYYSVIKLKLTAILSCVFPSPNTINLFPYESIVQIRFYFKSQVYTPDFLY